MPPRRPASPALVVTLAAVGALVAGAAGTGTYLWVSDHLNDQPAAQGPGPGGTDTTAGTQPTSPETTAAGEPCPDFTINQVKAKGHPGNLVTVLHVQGKKANGDQGEGWICRDSDGTLYYQGHDIDGQPWVAGRNTVLVGGGINGNVTQEGQTFVATVSYGRYRVGPDEFRLVGNNGDITIWLMD